MGIVVIVIIALLYKAIVYKPTDWSKMECSNAWYAEQERIDEEERQKELAERM